MTTSERVPQGLHAFLIHKTPHGDTSFRTRLFTQTQGVIECHYRGGRSPKKNALLQPFTPLWVLINERHQWFYINSVENTGLSYTFKGQALFAALYVNELIFHTASKHDSDAPLFLSYENTLRHLQEACQASDIEIGLRRFEKNLLHTTGYALSFDSDSELSHHIDSKQYYQFKPGQGFIESASGFSGEHLLAFAADQWDDPAVFKVAKLIMRQAIADLLDGQQLQSRLLYSQQLSFQQDASE